MCGFGTGHSPTVLGPNSSLLLSVTQIRTARQTQQHTVLPPSATRSTPRCHNTGDAPQKIININLAGCLSAVGSLLRAVRVQLRNGHETFEN